MKLSKLVKLSAVGVALLLIPRRSSRQSQRNADERSPDKRSPDNSHTNNEKHPIHDVQSHLVANYDTDADAEDNKNKDNNS